jgi:1-deoxy-D-xylulose-5-phosphate reductoisomerase
VRRIVLTASGGPFRTKNKTEMKQATVAEAMRHPTWNMGAKITLDSATLMNKGLEVIEAHWLFGAAPERIDVVVHPQSLVHSLVEYVDGSILAQLGSPDMRTVLANALAWPERIESGAERLDLLRQGRLDFHAPDRERFPCLGLAYAALRSGTVATCALNAANECAVAAFLDGALAFAAIPAVVETVLDEMDGIGADGIQDLDAILAYDARARRHADDEIARRSTME